MPPLCSLSIMVTGSIIVNLIYVAGGSILSRNFLVKL